MSRVHGQMTARMLVGNHGILVWATGLMLTKLWYLSLEGIVHLNIL